LRFENRDSRFPIPDSRLQIADCRLQIADFTLHIQGSRSQSPDSTLHIQESGLGMQVQRLCKAEDTNADVPEAWYVRNQGLRLFTFCNLSPPFQRGSRQASTTDPRIYNGVEDIHESLNAWFLRTRQFLAVFRDLESKPLALSPYLSLLSLRDHLSEDLTSLHQEYFLILQDSGGPMALCSTFPPRCRCLHGVYNKLWTRRGRPGLTTLHVHLL